MFLIDFNFVSGCCLLRPRRSCSCSSLRKHNHFWNRLLKLFICEMHKTPTKRRKGLLNHFFHVEAYRDRNIILRTIFRTAASGCFQCLSRLEVSLATGSNRHAHVHHNGE